MRCFLAIELSEEARNAVAGLRDRLRRAGANASWPRPENLHLTLRFLGEMDEECQAAIAARLRESLATLQSPALLVRGTGAFPNVRKPSVVWVGIESPGNALAAVQDACEQAAQAIGLKAEKKAFRPHITLARLREPYRAGRLVRALETDSGFFGGEFTASNVTLFSSTLTPQGAVYAPLEHFPLRILGDIRHE